MHNDSHGGDMIIDTAVYTDGRRTATETMEGALQARHAPDSFACIVLHEPHQEELASLAGGLEVDQMRLEQEIQHSRRAGIQSFENLLCVWLACARYPSGGQALQVGWICILLGQDLVVALSFGEGLEVLKAAHRRIENRPGRHWQVPQLILREIVDEVFDGYDQAIQHL